MAKDKCLKILRRAKVAVNVANDWRCEPLAGCSWSFLSICLYVYKECPKTRRDCKEYEFVDDMFGVISRRDCIKWVRDREIKK